MKMATGTGFSTSKITTSDEVYDFTCTLCAERNKNTEAFKFCLECRVYLCTGCTEQHDIFPLLRGHVMEEAKLTLKDKPFSLPYIPTERCRKHPAEIIKMYCAIHDQVACTVCTTIDHKTCNDIHYIPDVAGTLYTKQMNTDIITVLLKASEKMKTLKEMCHKALDDLNTARNTALQAIQEFRQELNHLLDKLEQNTKQQLDGQYQTLQTKLQVLIEKGTSLGQDLQKQLDQLQNTKSNTSQQFVLTKISKENISLADTMSSQLLSSSIQMTFSQSQAIKTCFEQMSTLGNVSNSIDQGKQELYMVKESQKYNVRIESDTVTCHIFGCCVLDSGHFLLSDNTNKKLKLFDTNKNAVTSYCTMPDLPCAVCIVSDVEAAVSIRNNMVQFVSISNGQLLPTRILNMNHECVGLAIVVDKMYITNDCIMYVHELNGKLVRTINKDRSGEQIFCKAYHVSVSNSSNIHVADYQNGMITLDTVDQVVWKYSESDLQGAVGVCTDGNGNVFVCGYESHNVLQLGLDGQRLGELVNKTHGVCQPLSMLFDRKNCKLIITNGSYDYILVFSLE